MGVDTVTNQGFLHDAGADDDHAVDGIVEGGDDDVVVAEIEAVDDVGMEVVRDEERCKAG